MKHTLFGYNQAVAVELGLNLEDLCILRWFEDFIDTGKMQEFEVNGDIYYWVKYDYIVKQITIIADDKRKITKKIKRLVDFNILDFYLLRKNGNYSLYKLNEENHKKLIKNGEKVLPKEVKGITKNGERVLPEMVDPITENGKTLLPEMVKPFTKNGETNINLSNINLSNNSSIKNESSKNTQAITLGDIDNFINLTIKSDDVKKALYSFIEHRISLKSAMNHNGVKLFVDKLNRYDDDKKIELINNAIINNWKDIYPKDDNSKNKNKTSEPRTNTSYDIQEAEKLLETVPSFI